MNLLLTNPLSSSFLVLACTIRRFECPYVIHPSGDLPRQTPTTNTTMGLFNKRNTTPVAADTTTATGSHREKRPRRHSKSHSSSYNSRPSFGQWLKATWLDILTMAAMGAIGLGVYMADPAPSRSFPSTYPVQHINHHHLTHYSRLPGWRDCLPRVCLPPAQRNHPHLGRRPHGLFHSLCRLFDRADSRPQLLGCQQCHYRPSILSHYRRSLPGLHQMAHWRSPPSLPRRLQACYP